MKNYETFEEWVLQGAIKGGIGDETEYPIAGCRETLERITEKIRRQGAEKILCIGPGSEQVAIQLYDDDCDIWIVENDPGRLAVLEAVMPEASFFGNDCLEGGEDSFFDMFGGSEFDAEDDGQEVEFDAVVWTYSAHRISDEKKMWMLDDLAATLSDEGVIYIGDVCFWTTAEREMCRRRCRSFWDDEASYLVYDSFKAWVDKEYDFDDLTRFTRTSHCSGIIEFGLDLEE